MCGLQFYFASSVLITVQSSLFSRKDNAVIEISLAVLQANKILLYKGNPASFAKSRPALLFFREPREEKY